MLKLKLNLFHTNNIQERKPSLGDLINYVPLTLDAHKTVKSVEFEGMRLTT